ncbi:MAG TPA: hypothetical protein EYP14_09830 [Planctomycetaceae bacterium]|nr:hypothetical protein [Planctomycetaceae bacterium]
MARQSDAYMLRRLRAAEGYLELGMPDQALEELDQIDSPGPYEAAKSFLKGEALKAQEHYEEAAQSLQRAALMFPFPHGRRAWQSLSECLRRTGREALADAAETNASLLEKAEHVLEKLAESLGEPSIIINITIQPRARRKKRQR